MKKYLSQKPIFVCFVILFSMTNCYFNPLVFDLLNPTEAKDNSTSLLSLTGFSNQATTVSITGQIKKAGIAFANAEIKVVDSPLSLKKNQTNSSTTNSAGRFYLNISTGFATLQFADAGTIVNIDINVTPFSATAISINNLNYQIQNLDVYEIGTEAPTYLELVLSMPYDGMFIDDANYSMISSSFQFGFSEDIATPSDQFLWMTENFIINPQIALQTPSISKNNVAVILSGSVSQTTGYTLTLNSGIKSVTGKSIKPSTIQFIVGPLSL